MPDHLLQCAASAVCQTKATQTTVSNERAGFDSVIVLSPRTANAAAESNHTYIKTKAKGSFIIGHRNTSNTDVKYDYIIVG